ncbi:hypothetical protein ACGFY9_45235 [Streptomyces sp. NPDC048504]
MFVGDTAWDMKAAVRDGVVPVAVLSGGIPRADLLDRLDRLDTRVFADRE